MRYSFLCLLCLFIAWDNLLNAQTNCSVNAGLSSEICVGDFFTLNGNVTGDFDPTSIVWTVVSQPIGSNIQISNVSSLTTNTSVVNFPGEYIFAIEAKCGEGLAMQSIENRVDPLPEVYIESISDFTCFPCDSTIRVEGTPLESDQTSKWVVRGSNGIPVFRELVDGHIIDIRFDCSSIECFAEEEIQVEYTIFSDKECKSSDTRKFDASLKSRINAGNNFSPCNQDSCFAIKGTCSPVVPGLWSIIEEPLGSTATIGDINAEETEMCITTSGTHIVTWQATDQCNSGADTMEIEILFIDAPDLPPIAATGGGGYCPGEMPEKLSFIGTDPGKEYDVQWIQTSGPPVSIENPDSIETLICGFEDGNSYGFIFKYDIEGDCINAITRVGVSSLSDETFSSTDCIFNYPTIHSNSSRTAFFVDEGPFKYNQIDCEITLTSFPPAMDQTDIVKLVVIENSNAIDSITGGETLNFKLDSLTKIITLHNLSGDDKKLFQYLAIENASHSGFYGFDVKFVSPCGISELNALIYFQLNQSLPNAGTLQVLNCGQDTTTLAGNLDQGTWIEISSPLNSPPVINQGYTGKNLKIDQLIEGLYTFGYVSSILEYDCERTYFTDTVTVLVSDNLPQLVEIPDFVNCSSSYQCIPLPNLTNGVFTSFNSTMNFDLFENEICFYVTDGTIVDEIFFTIANGCGTVSSSFSFEAQGLLSDIAEIQTVDSCLTDVFMFPVDISAAPISSLSSGQWSFIGNGDVTFLPSITSPDVSVTVANYVFGQEYFRFIWTVDDLTCGMTTSDTFVIRQDIFNSPNVETTFFDCTTSFPDTILFEIIEPNDFSTIEWSVLQSSFATLPTITNTTDPNTEIIFYGSGEYTISVNYRYEGNCSQNEFSDQIVVKLSEGSLIAISGPNLFSCNYSFLLDANGAQDQGFWTVVSTTPTFLGVTIVDFENPNSAVNFDGIGSAVLRWSLPALDPSCGEDTYDEVTLVNLDFSYEAYDSVACFSDSLSFEMNHLPFDESLGYWVIESNGIEGALTRISSIYTQYKNPGVGDHQIYFVLNNEGFDCFAADTFSFTVVEPIQLENDIISEEVCLGDLVDTFYYQLNNAIDFCIQNVTMDSISIGNTADYQIILDSDQKGFMVTPHPPIGENTFTIFYFNGVCQASNMLNILVVEAPFFEIIGVDTICLGESATLSLNMNIPPDAEVLWFDSDGFLIGTENTIEVTPAISTDYSAVINVESTNCQTEAFFNIIVLANLENYTIDASQTTIEIGQSSFLTIQGDSLSNVNIIWTPDETLNDAFINNPIATPTETTTYTALLDNGFCSVSLEVTIEVESICLIDEVIIPNVFSPNGDGLNDCYQINTTSLNHYYIMIADRWGEIIYKSSNPDECWDGTYKGEPLSPDVYGYYLELGCSEPEYEKIGNITLLK